MRIKIPFNDWSRARLAAGKKSCTSRTKRYGDPGDTFKVDGVEYHLTDVTHDLLADVKRYFFAEEGCATPEEFERIWDQIHPRKRFNGISRVWLHQFKRVTE